MSPGHNVAKLVLFRVEWTMSWGKGDSYISSEVHIFHFGGMGGSTDLCENHQKQTLPHTHPKMDTDVDTECCV